MTMVLQPRPWAALALLLLLATAGHGAEFAAPPSQQSAAALHADLVAGRRSAENVTRHFLARIAAMDGRYRSVIAVAPDAVEQARRLDRHRAAGKPLGRLHGIPVLLKDNIESRELPTTAGSLLLADNWTGRDAPLVAALRRQGAVILGKTNLSEWANFRSTRSSSGWSGVRGQTGNAVDPARNPCGSSSGSGTAAALAFAPLTVGTETNGSIVCPATINGVVGFKPTVGLVSRKGVVPISPSQDTAGPMARTVLDAALGLAAMVSPDADDPMAALAQGVVVPGQFEAADLMTLRVGVLRSATGYHDGVDALFDAAVAALGAGGATIIDDLAFDPPDGFGQHTFRILLNEFRTTMDAYLATLPGEPGGWTIEDLIAGNERLAADELRWFGQELLLQAADAPGMDDDDYGESLVLARRVTREEGIDRMLEAHDLDVIIAPTRGPAWMTDLVNGDHFGGGFSTYPAVAGYPHLTLPMGRVHGLPVGLSVFAGAGSDFAVLAAGMAIEGTGVGAAAWPEP
ncbi:MAG: amidase [Pseudomonadota bacterium]